MVSHISTFTVTNNLFDQSQRLQLNYATVNAQSASGLKSVNFEGISSSAQQLLAANTQSSTLDAQSIVIKSAQTRINALQSVTDSISNTLDSANTFFSSIQGEIDVNGGSASNVAHATTLRDELAGLLNSKVGGEYLFGGTATDKAPVDLTDPSYNPTAAPTTADTNYYQGNSTAESVRTSDSMRVTYGVTADNPAFEQAFRALTLFIANPTDPTTITQAFSLIKSAINGVGDISGDLIAKSNVITSEASVNSATTDYLSQTISGLRDADTAAAAVSASQIETQLQASYSSLAKLLNLRLSDYLK